MKALILLLSPLVSLVVWGENCTDDYNKLKPCEHEAVIQVDYGPCGETMSSEGVLEKPSVTWAAGGEEDEKKYVLLLDNHIEFRGEKGRTIIWLIRDLKGSDLKQGVVDGNDLLSFKTMKMSTLNVIQMFLFEQGANETSPSTVKRKGSDINKFVNKYNLCKSLVGAYEIKVPRTRAEDEESTTTYESTEDHGTLDKLETESSTTSKLETAETTTGEVENFTTTDDHVTEGVPTENTGSMVAMVKNESAHLHGLDGLLLLSAILCGALRGWIG